MTGYPSIDKPWLKYYSEEAVNAPLPECSLYQFFYENNRDHREEAAMDYFGRTISYGEMFENIGMAEKGFRSMGVADGTIVSAIAVSVPEIIYSFYALNKIGAVSNWIDPRQGMGEVVNALTMTNSKICIVQDIFMERFRDALLKIGDLRIIVVCFADSAPPLLKPVMALKRKKFTKDDRVVRYGELVKKSEAGAAGESFYGKNQMAVLEYTGGTTGTPKAVMLSNESCNAVVAQYERSGSPLKRGETWLSVAFPFTAYSLICSQHLPLSLGIKCVLCFELDISKVVTTLLRKKCNHVANTPIFWEKLIKDKKAQGKDFSFLITPIIGADSMSTESERRVNGFLESHGCRYRLAKGYGMTEVSSAIALTLTNEINREGSVGIPFDGMLVSVFDFGTGEELPYGEAGEICISGPSVMLGYYGQEEAANEVLRMHRDGRLWMHSGDIGYMDADGFLFISGRMKRMLIDHTGFKIFAPHVETVISRAPGVEKCCVVGAKDRAHEAGQVAVAFVKVSGEKEKTKEEIRVLLKEKLLEYNWPKVIKVVEELPYTNAGKVDYRALEKMAGEMTQ